MLAFAILAFNKLHRLTARRSPFLEILQLQIFFFVSSIFIQAD